MTHVKANKYTQVDKSSKAVIANYQKEPNKNALQHVTLLMVSRNREVGIQGQFHICNISKALPTRDNPFGQFYIFSKYSWLSTFNLAMAFLWGLLFLSPTSQLTKHFISFLWGFVDLYSFVIIAQLLLAHKPEELSYSRFSSFTKLEPKTLLDENKCQTTWTN